MGEQKGTGGGPLCASKRGTGEGWGQSGWRAWSHTRSSSTAAERNLVPFLPFQPAPTVNRVAPCNTKGYSSTYLAMGFANVRAGTWYPPEH